MGCVSSRPEFPNDVHPNVFTVATVSKPCTGVASASVSNSSSTGKLEVTANELILHRRGHEPVLWPLQYVRRYGYDNHLFSFESGRRCESGPGIFTFRCRRARDLFLMVQYNVQEARTPPLPPVADIQGVTVTERSRLNSLASQFHFTTPRGATANGVDPLSDDCTPASMTLMIGSLTTNGALYSSSNGTSPLASVRRLTTTESDGVSPLDESNGGQVFVEVAPMRNSSQQQQRRQRLSGARSQRSSVASDQSSCAQQCRPLSFELMFANDADTTTVTSPQSQPAGAMTPDTPPSSAYYVNIDPSSGPRSRKKDRSANGVQRTPVRSQSLGSAASTPESRPQHHFAADRAYVNINGWAVGEQEPISSTQSARQPQECASKTLDYVTLDVGTRAGTWAFQNRKHRRTSTSNGFASCGGWSLTSVTETDLLHGQTNLASGGDDAAAGPTAPTSNYARIDCTRTKALRETAVAAHLQRHSTSCSASSSEAAVVDPLVTTGRRTRHDSNVTSAEFMQMQAPQRQKHLSGSVER